MRTRLPLLLWVVFALLTAGFALHLRLRAVHQLPVDYDELTYLPAAFRYRDMMAEGRWREILSYRENLEHPPLNKLIYALDLWISGAPEPNWDELEVPDPISPSDRPAFWGPRRLSAVSGTLQVLLVSLVHPLAGLILAFDTYHIKYSAQVYLEAIPGLMAVLAVVLCERATRRGTDSPSDASVGWPSLVLSAAALGLAAAGKYIYGVTGLVLFAALLVQRRAIRSLVVFALVTTAVFFAADPFLWPNPPERLWESVTYHWDYSHSKHVVSAGMPWYSPVMHLAWPAPTQWHRGVFLTGLVDMLLLPLSIIGLPWAVRKRPLWVAWAATGLLFLFLWPTKWPQYILLVLPPLAVCAGIGCVEIACFWARGFRSSRSDSYR